MNQGDVILYDDAQGRWGPMTDLRAVFDLRTGAVTNLQRIERSLGRRIDALHVAQAGLAPLVAEHHARPVNRTAGGQPVLAVNGRWPGLRQADAVRSLPLDRALVQADGQVVAAHLRPTEAAAFLPTFGAGDLSRTVKRIEVDERLLMERPWHILDELDVNLAADLAAARVENDAPEFDAAAQQCIRFGEHGVYVAEDAVVQPGAIFNSEQGPIVVESKALIGALAVLEGPCYVGRESTIVCHAHIRPNAVIGPMCKAAGEISYSVIHSHSNKAHHGYMGHSLVGQWVNLGAATNMSNLKNTYGCVRVQLEKDEPPQETGRVFHGPIIGDCVRTAIGTRLLTGSCIATGAMIAHSGFIPKFVHRFAFITDGCKEPYNIDKLIATLRDMMARRHAAMSPALETRLRALNTNEQ